MLEEIKINSIRKKGWKQLKKFDESEITYDMCLAAVEMDGRAIESVPAKHLNEELCMLACKTYGYAIKLVPDELKTQELCDLAAKTAESAYYYIPDRFKKQEMYFGVAQHNYTFLKDMPVDLITPDFVISIMEKGRFVEEDVLNILPKELKNDSFYSEIVRKRPDYLLAIPFKYHTKEVCLAAIKAMGYNSAVDAMKQSPDLLGELNYSMYDHDTCLAFAQQDYIERNLNNWADIEDWYKKNKGIPHKKCREYSPQHLLRWRDVAEIAVQKNSQMLKDVKKSLVDYDLCMLAVKADGRAYYYVPDAIKTKELSEIAINSAPWVPKEVPEDFITEDMCLKAVRYSGYEIEAIPQKLLTREMVLIALQDKGQELEHIPAEMLDEELCLTALNNISGTSAYNILKKIPASLRTKAVCEAAVKADSSNLDYVPDECKSYEMCLEAAKHASSINIPEEFYTEELCLALLSRSAVGFDCIPKNKLTDRICHLAISHGDQFSGTVLKDIPNHLITQQLCDEAVEISVWSLGAVPDEFVTPDMLMSVAERAPGRLNDNFPQRFRNAEFIKEMIRRYPDSRRYVESYIE